MSDPSRKIRRKHLCVGKIKWQTQDDADYAAELHRIKTGEYMNVYYCGVGKYGHWHIGHARFQSHDRLDYAFKAIQQGGDS